MEQRKVNAKDIFLLLGSIGAAFGVNFGIALIGGMIITIYFVAVHGYNVEEVMQLVVSPGITMKLSCVMHASFILIFGIWYKFGFVKKNKIPVKQVFGIRNVICFAALGLGFQICISYALELVNIVFPAVMESYMKLMETMNIGNSWMAFVMTVFMAPIGEELIFRGVIMGYGKRVMPFLWANLIQAVLFGIYHMNLVQGAYAFVLGLVLGYLAKKCDSLLASIAVHFVINGSANVLSFLTSGASETASVGAGDMAVIVIISVMSAIICAVACYFVKGREVEG
ncbi:MAG: CPBP family intramembrane metalloprotease [Lachnospiraceae bacterium]|nr:CPBP family intramembrane metalloprotease [Lachnospiraceae bacterium]